MTEIKTDKYIVRFHPSPRPPDVVKRDIDAAAVRFARELMRLNLIQGEAT